MPALPVMGRIVRSPSALVAAERARPALVGQPRARCPRSRDGAHLFVHHPRRLLRSERVPRSWGSRGQDARAPVMGRICSFTIRAGCLEASASRARGAVEGKMPALP